MQIGTAIAVVGLAICSTAIAIFAPVEVTGVLCGTLAFLAFFYLLTK